MKNTYWPFPCLVKMILCGEPKIPLALLLTIFFFSVFGLSDQVRVQYKSKVVKYTWPKSHQVADAIPWVQVTLANGQTFQTKLLGRPTAE